MIDYKQNKGVQFSPIDSFQGNYEIRWNIIKNFSIFLLLLLMSTGRLALANESIAFGPIEFEIPKGWSCQNQGQSLICLDKSPNSAKNAAIVASYKNKSGEDALPVYRDQLSRPRVLKVGEISKPSSPKGVRDIFINGLTWIEGIHFASEMPSFYTHYYATTAFDFAVLVSISIEDVSHEEILRLLMPTIYSMKIHSDSPHSNGSAIDQSVQVTGQPNSSTMTNTAPSTVDGFEIMGIKIKRMHMILAVGTLVVLGLMIYAFTME